VLSIGSAQAGPAALARTEDDVDAVALAGRVMENHMT
jgi:hypothetical protein